MSRPFLAVVFAVSACAQGGPSDSGWQGGGSAGASGSTSTGSGSSGGAGPSEAGDTSGGAGLTGGSSSGELASTGGSSGGPPAGECPCYAGDGPYCGVGVSDYGGAQGCGVDLLPEHAGDVLSCEGGQWSLAEACEAGCEVTAPGESDACALPVCDCFVKEAWCGSGAAEHGLTLDPPCRVPLVPEHNGDILGCDGDAWIVKQSCPAGCHEEMVGVPDSCNDDSAYRLPFACGTAQTCSQGNFGSSHQGSQAYAWDFAMPRGTAVHAARGGLVAYLEMRSPPGSACYDPGPLDEGCHNKANFIGVRHQDGTVGLYMHLRAMKVKLGDAVAQGALLAESGNSGYTSGPHLHFQLQNDCGLWFCASVPVGFADAPDLKKGDKPESGNCP